MFKSSLLVMIINMLMMRILNLQKKKESLNIHAERLFGAGKTLDSHQPGKK